MKRFFFKLFHYAMHLVFCHNLPLPRPLWMMLIHALEYLGRGFAVAAGFLHVLPSLFAYFRLAFPHRLHLGNLRFLAAIAPKVKLVKELVSGVLTVPKTETPCLCMKSRFKLEDCMK